MATKNFWYISLENHHFHNVEAISTNDPNIWDIPCFNVKGTIDKDLFESIDTAWIRMDNEIVKKQDELSTFAYHVRSIYRNESNKIINKCCGKCLFWMEKADHLNEGWRYCDCPSKDDVVASASDFTCNSFKPYV